MENTNKSLKGSKNSVLTVKNMSKIAILSAVAFILMVFDFALPFLPPFYKFDFSEAVVMIGTFAMGPIAGVWIEGIKVILNAFIHGTQTAYIGDFAAFFMGIAYIIPAGMIYQKEHSIKGAIKGMIAGTLITTIVAMITNYYLLLPAYVTFAGFTMESIIAWTNSINPFITDIFTLIIIGTLPFNLIKWTIISVVVKLLYKHVSPILKK